MPTLSYPSMRTLAALVVGWMAAALPMVAHAAPTGGRRALVVLGTAARSDGSPSPGLSHRLDAALHEAARDPKALVVVTGGAVANRVAEGPAMRDWLVAHGVDRSRIAVEGRARFTRDNARLTVPLLRRASATHVTVVTERYHVRRGVLEMKAALRAAGMRRVGVDAIAAPDGLRGGDQRRVHDIERQKWSRDRALWAADSPRR
jgi:uncharacterized SAM-binding protein YcdF (DUF218 family)